MGYRQLCPGEWVGTGEGSEREKRVQGRDSGLHKGLLNQGDHRKALASFSFRGIWDHFPTAAVLKGCSRDPGDPQDTFRSP